MAADYAQILKLNQLVTGHRTMVILMIHPHYFAYLPSVQWLLYPIYGSTIALFRIAQNKLQTRSSDPTLKSILDEVVAVATSMGILEDLGRAKESAIQNISRRQTPR